MPLYLVGSKKEVRNRKTRQVRVHPPVAADFSGSNGAIFAFDWVNDMGGREVER